MLNKEVYISRRRKLKENFKDGLILIMGNDFSPLDCEDNTYPFIQDATFRYYFGIDHNGLIGIIDIDKNEEIIFGNDYTMSDIIWMGKQKFLKELAIEVGIEKFIEKEELKKYLENRKNIRFTNQYKTDNIMYLSSILNINPFEFDKNISFDLVKAIIKQRNIELRLVDTFYPSSKTCSCCGSIKRNLKLNDRIYKCCNCGLEMDRDYNASINLEKAKVYKIIA